LILIKFTKFVSCFFLFSLPFVYNYSVFKVFKIYLKFEISDLIYEKAIEDFVVKFTNIK